MATNVLSDNPYTPSGEQPEPQPRSIGDVLRIILKPLASLKLTVVLFAMAIFIVLAGTVAQIDMDVWEVVHRYFRSLIAWIPFQIFFPRTLNIAGGFYFPGGWLIGAMMGLNLLAAHAVRFKVQTRGARLAAGLAVIAAGMALTCWVIVGIGAVSWPTLWNVLKCGLVAAVVGVIYRLATFKGPHRLERYLWFGVGTVLAAVTVWLFTSDFKPDGSSMRILWQLMQGTAAGLVLLAGCALAFRKRAGIVLIHAGIGLMMFNELYVGLTSDEAQMNLQIGEVRNYAEDIRSAELAVVDPSDPVKDDVTIVPKSILLAGSVIQNEHLPFDLRVVKFLPNSEVLERVPKGATNPATAGAGLHDFATERRGGTGVDTDMKADIPSAYVELLKKGTREPIGTYLVSELLKPDEVKVDGKSYQISLRFKRNYKPYAVQLVNAESKVYDGTKTPKDYSSYINLVDPATHTDRSDVHIWMNNPLRFQGETFYQTGFFHDDDSGATFSTLSVVTNRGWMIPYTGCMIVVVGLLAHFLGVLVRFLRRQESAAALGNAAPSVYAAAVVSETSGATSSGRIARAARRKAERQALSEPPPDGWKMVGDFFPWVVVALLAGWALSKAVPPRTAPGAMDLYEFGKLPVMYEGRVKPFDTLARNTLMAICDKQTYDDADGPEELADAKQSAKPPTEKRIHPAIEWCLDVITGSPRAEQAPVFNIESPEVLDLLGLKWRDHHRYTLAEINVRVKEFRKQADLADKTEPAKRSLFQNKVLDLDRRLEAFNALDNSFRPLPFPQMPSEEEIKKDPEAATQTAMEIRDLLKKMPAFHEAVMKMQLPRPVPSATGDGVWQPFGLALDLAYVARSLTQTEPNPNTLAWGGIFHAYSQQQVKAFDAAAAPIQDRARLQDEAQQEARKFNAEVAKYRAALAADPPPPLNADKTDFEAFFNHAEPFYSGMVLYLTAFVLACFGLLGWRGPLNRAAFWLILATWLLHTAALIGRIYISGRPPVTNLYSAAVFIGWAAVLFGMVLEGVFRLGVGNMLAGIAGFAALFIAHFLAASGDTLTVMQAVLDTQFWLATHVVCVTLGYTATFVAGLLGIIYILRGLLTTNLTSEEAKSLVKMIYGVICFGIFFSFVGTVLGGLWADDSWGRFWGWDPKENGALIIVLWNALVLHARWDGLVKDRGLAVLAVGGNIATAWSMFGVNELGIGLHSYGFTEGVKLALLVGVGVHLAIIAAGMLPKRYWASFRAAPEQPA